MNTIETQTGTAEETVALGERLAGGLRIGDVVALVGQLGAGKTQMTRGIASGLGVNPRLVASPTFILMSEYAGRLPVVHIDAYRIQSLADLESIGFTAELLENSVTVIEWADRIAADLPTNHLQVELTHTEGGRKIVMTPVGRFAERAGDLQKLIAPAGGLAAPTTQPCRMCKKPVRMDAPTFPFCSDRCRLVDLNRWFMGSYSLSRPITGDDELTPDS